mmetsp:Transcript_50267/g.86478  ORF Transcript_50267/g.86478 Transcript_50267/m.86478 type:complete len:317 (+) Transcript_50267:539-1489(+)
MVLFCHSSTNQNPQQTTTGTCHKQPTRRRLPRPDRTQGARRRQLSSRPPGSSSQRRLAATRATAPPSGGVGHHGHHRVVGPGPGAPRRGPPPIEPPRASHARRRRGFVRRPRGLGLLRERERRRFCSAHGIKFTVQVKTWNFPGGGHADELPLAGAPGMEVRRADALTVQRVVERPRAQFVVSFSMGFSKSWLGTPELLTVGHPLGGDVLREGAVHLRRVQAPGARQLPEPHQRSISSSPCIAFGTKEGSMPELRVPAARPVGEERDGRRRRPRLGGRPVIGALVHKGGVGSLGLLHIQAPAEVVNVLPRTACDST